MKASEIITWARSVANISAAKFIDPTDEDNSLNASWRDLHTRILDSDDDYFTKIVTIVLTAGMAVVGGTNEWLIPMPEDFLRLRTLEYQGGTTGGQWYPMVRFSLSERTDWKHTPSYRMDNNNLWIVGLDISQVRVKYYPPPATITHPQPDLTFATAVTPNNFPLITSPVYAAWKNTGAYIYSAQNIVEGSIDDGTTGTPVTLGAIGANISNLVYYKGYLYWVQAADIKRAPTDLKTAPLVPAAVTAVANILTFQIDHDTIYYTTAAQIRSCALTGAGDTLIDNYVATSICSTLNGDIWFTEAITNHLHKLFVAPEFDATALMVTTDGVDLYVRHADKSIDKHSGIDGSVLGQIYTDVAVMGPWSGGRLPVLTAESQKYVAISTIIDTNIAYPLNLVLEIMAYQSAVDFKTKLSEDPSGLLLRLGHPSGPDGPASGLWARFEKTAKRDDYRAEKISNSRRTMAGNW